MLGKVQETVDLVECNLTSRDIRPSDNAPVIDGQEAKLRLTTMAWGFPKFDGKGLLINARAETVTEKPTFRDSVLHRRCAIPASQFYEWDRVKNKATFFDAASPVLYFAGFYRVDSSGARFVILTTAANTSVLPVHDRMPLMIGRSQISAWIFDTLRVREILQQRPTLELQQLR